MTTTDKANHSVGSFADQVRRFYRKYRQDGHKATDALRHARWSAKYDPRAKSNKLDVMPSRYEAYEGEKITALPNGWKIRVEFECGSDMPPPWENSDGMGVVEEFRGYDGPGEYGEYDAWILASDRGKYLYYDWKATLPEAIRDGWNTAPYHFHSKREQAMAAMKSTYEYLRHWCDDGWWYVGMIVTLLGKDDNELAKDSCWGFESSSMDYLCDEARDMAATMIRGARRAERQAAHALRVANRFHDAMENAL